MAEKKAVAKKGSNGDAEKFADRTAKQYLKREGEEKLNDEEGDPCLVYESKLVNSFEPTGVPVSSIFLTPLNILLTIQDAVEITRCTGRED